MSLNEDEERDLLIVSFNKKNSNKLLDKLMLSLQFKNNKSCSTTMPSHFKQRRKKFELFRPKFIIFCVVFIQLFTVNLAQLAAKLNNTLPAQSGLNHHNSSTSYYVVRNPIALESTEKRSPAFLNDNTDLTMNRDPVSQGIETYHSPPNQMVENLPPNFASPAFSPIHQQANAPPIFEKRAQQDDASAKGSQIINDSGKRRQYIPTFENEFGPAMAPALSGGPVPPGPVSTCPSGGPSLPVECDPKRPWPQCPPQSYCYATNTVDIGPYFCCPIWSTYGAAWRPATPFYNYAPPPPPNWPNAIRFADPVPFGPPRKSKKEPRLNDASSVAEGPSSDQIKIQNVVNEWTQRQTPTEAEKAKGFNVIISTTPIPTKNDSPVLFGAKLT